MTNALHDPSSPGLPSSRQMSKTAGCFSRLPLTIADMSRDQDDLRWEAFVTSMLAAGPAVERRSRYGDKPALFAGSREIAHLEAPGVIDLRITRAGWVRVREDFGHDARRPSRSVAPRLDRASPALSGRPRPSRRAGGRRDGSQRMAGRIR